MFWRAVTTTVIWSLAAGLVFTLTNQFSETIVTGYTMMDGARDLYPYSYPTTEVIFAPWSTVLMLGTLCALVLIGAAISTAAVWRRAEETTSRSPLASAVESFAQTTKVKTGQRDRARRLVESLSEDELDALERAYLVDGTGEPITYEDYEAESQGRALRR